MTLKELKYVLYGEDRLSGKLNRVNGASIKTNRALNTTSNRLGSLKRNIAGAANEIPGLNAGLRILTNPLTMAAGLVTGLGLALNKAKNEAVAFNNEFRELINLNLDKSPFQRALLKANVLETAALKGFDPLKTSTGYYDVQSITGKYGYGAKRIVEQVGEFSRVMRSDFNKTISGSAQAMDIYGVKTKDLDKYLTSLYKTVMVGKTTFDELTRVQVEYTNAAASSGQNYDNANKIFAAFSKTEKTVDIAATKTKTAFEDLTKKSTLKGLANIGVKVFDARKQMLGVDEILKNLIPKLKRMNDLEYAKLKEEIGGSEGIRGLLDLARNKADQLLASFQQFDNTKFSINDALREARNDLTFINDEINNKIKVSWINLGEAVLPVWVSIKKTILETIDSINDKMYNTLRTYYRVFGREKYEQLGQIRSEQQLEKGYYGAKEKTEKLISDSDYNIKNLTDKVKNEFIDKLKAEREKVSLAGYGISPHVGLVGQEWTDAENKVTGMVKFYNETIRALQTDNINKINEMFGNLGGGYTTDGSSAVTPDPAIIKALASIAGGGTQQKNITVNIAKFFDEQIINTTNLTEAAPEIEEKVKEVMIRAIAGAEQMID